jgi:hypothetical protein
VVGQRDGVAECLADRRGRARGLSLRASRDLAPPPKGLWFTIPEAELHELISNRGASAKIRTARRPRKAEVSGHESRRSLSRVAQWDMVLSLHGKSARAVRRRISKERSA